MIKFIYTFNNEKTNNTLTGNKNTYIQKIVTRYTLLK